MVELERFKQMSSECFGVLKACPGEIPPGRNKRSYCLAARTFDLDVKHDSAALDNHRRIRSGHSARDSRTSFNWLTADPPHDRVFPTE